MPDDKKEKILNAAVVLFSKNGYGNTPISRIAREAGVAQGLMYNYFRSKEDLLKGILENGFYEIKQSLEPYLTPGEPSAKIRQHIELSLSLVRSRPEFWRLVNSLRMQTETLAKLGNEVAQMNTFILSTLEDHFNELGYENPDKEALLFFAVFDGMVNLYLTMGDAFPVDELKEFLLAKYNA